MFTAANEKTPKELTQAGFNRNGTSAHYARTMMLDELEALLAAEPDESARRGRYQACVARENCLAKRSAISREITFRHLARLYGLDPEIPVFRALRHLWAKDGASRPLLALLCAHARDPLLYYAAPFIWQHKPGEEISSAAVADFLKKKYETRLSQATLNSASRNIRSTFTQSGHLRGNSQKTRARVNATPASVVYALYLAHLEGLSGKSLFQTASMALLDCNFEQSWELAQIAAQKGWLIAKRIDDIIEIEFPKWRRI